MNNLQLCLSFLKLTTGHGFEKVERFCLADQVTFRYYRGRLALLDGEYEKVGLSMYRLIGKYT